MSAAKLTVVSMILVLFSASYGQDPGQPTTAANPPAPARGTEKSKSDKERPDLSALRDAGVGTSGQELLAFLATQVGDDDGVPGLDKQLRLLGDDDFDTRTRAAARIIALGRQALPVLRKAETTTTDKEISRQITHCIQQIESTERSFVIGAAIREIIRAKPDGVADGLFRVLPYVHNQDLETDIAYALHGMAKTPAVLSLLEKGLSDAVPLRKAIAGCIVAHLGDNGQRNLAKKLLTDSDPQVRLRTAQGLLAVGEMESIPTLIELLDHSHICLAWQAEELLRYAAVCSSPSVFIAKGGASSRTLCKAAWEKWWKTERERVDLDPARRYGLCPTLLLGWNRGFGKTPSSVFLFGSDGFVRWRVDLPSIHPNGALLCPDGDILITSSPYETNLRRPDAGFFGVCRLSPDGSNRWKAGQNLICSQPLSLSEDMVFVSCGRLVWGTVDDKGLLQLQKPILDARDARLLWSNEIRLLPSGRVLASKTDSDGFYLVEFDRSTRRAVWQTSFKTDQLRRGCEVTPTACGNYLLLGDLVGVAKETTPKQQASLGEIDREGKFLWTSLVNRGTMVGPLRNGNTMLCGQREITGDPPITEVSPSGTIVGEYYLQQYRIDNARHCVELLRLGFDDASHQAEHTDKTLALHIGGLHSGDTWTRARTVALLGRHGKVLTEAQVSSLIDALGDTEPGVRELAKSIGISQIKPEFLRLLVAKAKDARPLLREGLMHALLHFSKEADKIVPALLAGTKDADTHVRIAALRSLGALGPETNGVIPALTEALRDHDHVDGKSGWSGAAMALWYFQWYFDGQSADKIKDYKAKLAPILPAIEQATKDRDATTRVLGTLVIGKLGPAAESSVPVLIGFLKATDISDADERTNVRQKVIEALGSIGSGAKSSVPLLEMIAKGDEMELREAAAAAIAKIKR